MKSEGMELAPELDRKDTQTKMYTPSEGRVTLEIISVLHGSHSSTTENV